MGILGKIFSHGTANAKIAKKLKCTAVIAAAGSSTRMNGENKMFSDIAGIPVVIRSILALNDCDSVDEIIVVAREEDIVDIADYYKKFDMSKVTKILAGGSTRPESVFIGLCEVGGDSDLIAVHDGARPLVTADVIDRAVRAAAKYTAAAPAVPVKDTIKTAVNGFVTETPDRSNMFYIQTPQVFRAEIIKAALKKALEEKLPITDDCMAVEAIGCRVFLSEGSYENIKITTPSDISVAEAILESRCGK